LRINGDEKGIFYEQGNSLGVWTNVAGNYNNFLITGEGETTFGDTTGSEITVSNTANEFTLTYLPQTAGTPTDVQTEFFAAKARNLVSSVDIEGA
jgi:hypothetical protein